METLTKTVTFRIEKTSNNGITRDMAGVSEAIEKAYAQFQQMGVSGYVFSGEAVELDDHYEITFDYPELVTTMN